MEKSFSHNRFTATFSDEGTSPANRYFSFTGKVFSRGSGAVGDAIATIYPPFKILNDLHLATLDGEPMYAVENAAYHFEQANWDFKALENYWKVTLTDEQKRKIQIEVDRLKEGYGFTKNIKYALCAIVAEIRPIWKAKVAAAYKLVAETDSILPFSIDHFDDLKKKERDERAEKFKHYQKTKLFRVIDTMGVPHPYCITSRHLSAHDGITGGTLDGYAISQAEKNGARCGMKDCNLPYSEHKQALLIEVDHPGDIKAVDKELREYLLSIKELTEKEKYVGFVFIQSLRFSEKG